MDESSLDKAVGKLEGQEIIERAQNQMAIISHSSNHVNELMGDLTKQIHEINHITSAITAITASRAVSAN